MSRPGSPWARCRGGTDAFAGSLGQVSYALDAADGAPLTGWPFFNSDSTHSTAALADLYGTGQNEIVVGGDQTAGLGPGPDATPTAATCGS